MDLTMAHEKIRGYLLQVRRAGEDIINTSVVT